MAGPVITKADLQAAFEAGKTGQSFQGWLAAYFTCHDCGRDTSGEHIHACPARAKRQGPYRTKAT